MLFAMHFKKVSVIFLAAFFLAPALPAQTTTPVAISVKDQSGAVVSHAQVRIVPAPDAASKMETNDLGVLTLDLKPGTYGVFVRMPGFREFAAHVRVAETKEVQTIPVVLQVASGSTGEVQPTPAEALVLLTYPYDDEIRLSVSDFKAMPHVSVTIHNSHINADETYSGVRLADLLSKMGAPLESELRAEALALYVLATGSDGYKAVFALAEVDPSFHPGEVLVADAMDGKPLDAYSGPFRLVVTEDKRPARSVRNLVSIQLKSAK